MCNGHHPRALHERTVKIDLASMCYFTDGSDSNRMNDFGLNSSLADVVLLTCSDFFLRFEILPFEIIAVFKTPGLFPEPAFRYQNCEPVLYVYV